jgi:hypothetical protein
MATQVFLTVSSFRLVEIPVNQLFKIFITNKKVRASEVACSFSVSQFNLLTLFMYSEYWNRTVEHDLVGDTFMKKVIDK